VAAPRDNGRLLSEVEAHLRDAQATAVAQGLSRLDAADVAVARVGPAAQTTEAAAAQQRVPSLFLRVAAQTVRLGAVSLVVLGLNGLLGEPLSWLLGMDFFFGDERTVPVSPERCAQLHRLQPAQATCNGALVEHHFGEYIDNGLGALVLGAAMLAAVRAWRFRFEPVGFERNLLELAVGLAAVVQFSLLAVVELPKGLLGTLRDPHLGSGRSLSQGVVCALAAGVFSALAVRQARQRQQAKAGQGLKGCSSGSSSPVLTAPGILASMPALEGRLAAGGA
jgi:hypothetical protein